MRVGFFGGSFDPPHVGHLAVARAAASTFHLNRVLLAPVASQPLKPNNAEASFDDRLHMVQLLCEQAGALEASAIDGPRPDGAPNYTIDTLERLRSTLPEEAGIFVIVGADSFQTLRQWRSPDELLRVAEWIVVSRPHAAGPSAVSSSEPLHLTPAQQAHIHLLEGVAEPASATTVRERLRAGDSCEDLLPASILSYIHTHHLYGT